MSRFPPGFLERVQRLSQAPRLRGTALHGTVPRSGVGEGLVFEDHRPYAPGDELRSIDWNATARLGEAYVKRQRREETRRLGIVLDASLSMDFGSPNKLDGAIQVAAAVALMAVRSGARVELSPFPAEAGRNLSIDRWVDASTFLLDLDAVSAARGSRKAHEALVARHASARERRTIWVLTDAYELEPWLRTLEGWRTRGHQPVLWQIFSPEEVRPPLQGTVRLVSSEEERTRDLTWDLEAQSVYQHRLEHFLETIEHACARLRVPFFSHVTELDPLEALSRFLRRGREGS